MVNKPYTVFTGRVFSHDAMAVTDVNVMAA